MSTKTPFEPRFKPDDSIFCASGDRQHPSGGSVLPGAGSCEHTAQNSSGWHSHLRHEAALPGGGAASLQHPHVPSHVCNQHAQTSPETARCVCVCV